MKFGAVPIDDAAGALLAHKLRDGAGRVLFNKGHALSPADIETLRAAGIERVTVAALSSTDVPENDAARRIGTALAGDGVKMSAPGVGRANLIAERRGVLRVNIAALERLNNIDEGITIATLRSHALVEARQLVTLVKIIPFGVPRARVEDVEAIAADAAPVIAVRELRAASVALIVTGPERQRETLLNDYAPPTRARIESLGSALESVVYVTHEPEAIAAAIRAEHAAGRGLIVIAGVSATIDYADVIPSGLAAAGGSVAHFGVPVDPGSLLMLGYVNAIPVIGAPGCARSPKFNVIDLVLPRLLSGERLTRADLVALGHGGLLDDVRERPMPRDLSAADD
jgi:molybdenum cofactor cytidylyltransferase